MRYAVLSDIHGNLHALEAVLAVAERHGVDAYLCTGDLVGYGPHPNECVEAVASMTAICIAGNHDLVAAGRLSPRRCTPFARESLAWTGTVLRESTRKYLAALPLRAEIDAVVLSHGSLEDPEEYVRTPAQAAGQLTQLAARDRNARVLCLGHTHVPWAFGSTSGEVLNRGSGRVRLHSDERYLLNAGSVGQPRVRSPRARVLVLDGHDAWFLAVPYDVAGCRAALERLNRPAHSCHAKPPLLERPRRVARRAAALLRSPRPR